MRKSRYFTSTTMLFDASMLQFNDTPSNSRTPSHRSHTGNKKTHQHSKGPQLEEISVTDSLTGMHELLSRNVIAK